MGIEGNESADSIAKESLKHEKVDVSIALGRADLLRGSREEWKGSGRVCGRGTQRVDTVLLFLAASD